MTNSNHIIFLDKSQLIQSNLVNVVAIVFKLIERYVN